MTQVITPPSPLLQQEGELEQTHGIKILAGMIHAGAALVKNLKNAMGNRMDHNFSSIQNYILSNLKNASKLRYSEMQPENVSNDLFNYHLKFLVNKGFVFKNKDGYSLSDVGIKYLADPQSSGSTITSLFKMNVITIVSRVKNGKIEILSQLRKSNPSYGKVGVMGGVVFKSELIKSAATRKLKQETGLDAKFKLVGCERRIMYKSGELFSDVIFPITHASSYKGELIVENKFGNNTWVSIEKAISNESSDYDSIKGIVKVLKAIKNKSINKLPFFFEETIQSDV